MLKLSFVRSALFGVVSKAVPRCTAQASRTCAGILPTRAAIAVITGSSSNPGLIPCPNGAKASSTMPFLVAEFQKLSFRQMRMRLYLDHGRLDSRRFVDGQQLIQADVRESDGTASAAVNETLQRPPGIEQRHTAVIDDIAALIPRVLLVSRLKRKRSVNEVEIQVIEPESISGSHRKPVRRARADDWCSTTLW